MVRLLAMIFKIFLIYSKRNGGYSSVVNRRANALTRSVHLKNPSTKLKIPFGYLPVNKIAIKEKTVEITTPIKRKIRAMM